MKTLNIIQTLSKIGKIISKVIFICCIIGFSGCIVGILAMFIGEQAVKIGGVTLHGILQTEAGVSEGTIWAAINVGMIFCGGGIALSAMAHRYFVNELNAGTPFTLSGAKELLRLGIFAIGIPVASSTLAQIVYDIFANTMEGVANMDLDAYGSAAIGVMLIVVSLLCRYGAELNAERDDAHGEE